jgi:hypothetical protein
LGLPSFAVLAAAGGRRDDRFVLLAVALRRRSSSLCGSTRVGGSYEGRAFPARFCSAAPFFFFLVETRRCGAVAGCRPKRVAMNSSPPMGMARARAISRAGGGVSPRGTRMEPESASLLRRRVSRERQRRRRHQQQGSARLCRGSAFGRSDATAKARHWRGRRRAHERAGASVSPEERGSAGSSSCRRIPSRREAPGGPVPSGSERDSRAPWAVLAT